jgi:2-C-methyl-D-erythritol 2,4-cyclodiphosphate synthase
MVMEQTRGRNRKRPQRSGTEFATAIGQDSHRFAGARSRRPLVLGGITIPGCRGCEGNSDADVVIHAITNAVSGISGINILGAIADRMCREQGISNSAAYLAAALATLDGWRLSHVSVSIEARRPVLAPHLHAMRAAIARLCGCGIEHVGITATSGERLTAFGRGEGIQAFAVVTARK